MGEPYASAIRRQPELRRRAQLQRQQERLEKAGSYGLFDLADFAAASPVAAPLYQIRALRESPHEPYRLPGRPPRHAHS